MKIKMSFLLLLLYISTNISFCQEKFSYGFKGGINLFRLSYLNGPHISSDKNNSPIFTYSVGLSMGIFIENKFTKDFSLVNELFFQKDGTKLKISTWYEGKVEQELTMQFINLSFLPKYQTTWLINTYFYLGPSFGYLIKANYKYYDRIYLDKGDVKITKDLPTINTSIEFGVGEKMDLSETTTVNIELRAQQGITKFNHMNNNYISIGNWRNFSLLFLVGLKFN